MGGGGGGGNRYDTQMRAHLLMLSTVCKRVSNQAFCREWFYTGLLPLVQCLPPLYIMSLNLALPDFRGFVFLLHEGRVARQAER